MRFLVSFLIMVFALPAFAYVVPTYRDLKPASQQMIEKDTITTPILADADRMKNDYAATTGVTTISSFLAQPDVPRNITFTTGGTTDDCNAGSITVTGKNIYNQTITEAFAITENQAGATAGLKAFKTVSSVVVHAQDDAGCTYDMGVGDVLGLTKCMAQAGHVVFATFNGAYEGTRPTCVADADEVEKNTCDINGTLDGAKNVEIFYIQNFACKP